MDRCAREAAEVHGRVPKVERNSEPSREFLLGPPGAGKSECLKWTIRYFQECLGWEHGVQYQCLASQHTMAAVIGGTTIHGWGKVPVNTTQLYQAAARKKNDLNIDDLFLNAQSIRWILIDEISTAGAMLLGVFDTNMRRARSRQTYAKRNDGTARPFGGVNLRLCGDFLQLPPVRAIGLYSNPFASDMEFAEQRAMDYVWKHTVDGINKVCELAVVHRQKDPWLASVLQEHRNGAETWETYCFVHGLPTKHAGSWLPSTDATICGQAGCMALAQLWAQLQPWQTRRSQECEICQTERQRRCRVAMPTNHNAMKHTEPSFANAPYIHPFNAVRYTAQILRSVNYAKATKQRLLWIRAHDWPIAKGDEDIAPEDLDEMRNEWLKYHDKKTGGIMGLMPLAHEMPMRLTETKDASKQAFKNARVSVIGWCLPPGERDRLAATDAPEIVLRERPTFIKVRITNPRGHRAPVDARFKDENPFTLVLKPQVCIWSRDERGQAKVRRIGFPLVPEFGGTVHAYCGTTLDAAQSDLLHWTKKPTPEDMQKAYINESRVRAADDLLIVQPYSPQLFRQGRLPGPEILLNVLRGNARRIHCPLKPTIGLCLQNVQKRFWLGSKTAKKQPFLSTLQ